MIIANLFFFAIRYPKNEELREKWIKLSRPSAEITRWSSVCSDHFSKKNLKKNNNGFMLKLFALPEDAVTEEYLVSLMQFVITI